jgi:hypothetical protein
MCAPNDAAHDEPTTKELPMLPQSAIETTKAMAMLTAFVLGTAAFAGCGSEATSGNVGETSESELSRPLTLAQLKNGLTRSFVPVKSDSNPYLLDGLVIAKGTPKIVDTARAAVSTDKHDALSPAFLAKLASPKAIELTHDYYVYTPVFEGAPSRSAGKLAILAGKVPGEKYLVMERDLSAAYLAEENANLAQNGWSYVTAKYLYFKIDLAEGAPNATGELDLRWLNITTFGDAKPLPTKPDGGLVDPFAAAQNTCFSMNAEWFSMDPNCATLRLAASSTYFGPQAARGDVFCGTFRDVYQPENAIDPEMQAQGNADCAWALGGSSPRVTTAATCAKGKPTGWSCVAPPQSAASSFDLARCAPRCAP